jgi:hypothetical protein
MAASRRVGNLQEHDGTDPTKRHSEETPKGHTKFHNIGDGYIYFASQPFHDWKQGLDRSDDDFPFPLEDFRGGKFFRLNQATGQIEDMSAKSTFGPEYIDPYPTSPADTKVAVKHEGIITLEYWKEKELFVGLTHPNNLLVFWDHKKNEVVRIADTRGSGPEDPNYFGHKLVTPGDNNSAHITISREMVIDNDHDRIFLFRDIENNNQTTPRAMFTYTYGTNKFEATKQMLLGGMWGGAAINPATKKGYVTHNGGQITEIDFATGTATQLNNPAAQGSTIYFLTPNEDWSKLYFSPNQSRSPNAGLWEMDMETKVVTQTYSIPGSDGPRNVTTGQFDMLRDGKYYTTTFGNNGGSWGSENASIDTNARQARIFVYNLAAIEALDD